MEKSSDKREKRRSPRFLIDLPLEYREADLPHARGGIAVNASEKGLLVESVKAIKMGTKLNVSVLFPKRFQLAKLKLEAEIVWKEPLLKEDWEGYQYGLKIIQILEEDYSKLKMILDGQFNLDTINIFSEEKRTTEPSERDTGKIPEYKVLVVDDEKGVRRLLATLLAQKGHQCVEATDGMDALDKAATDRFDAIVTDIVMPRMDGIALAKDLLKRIPGLPIMVMTAHDNEFSAMAAMAAGAREFIKKPFSSAEFATRFDNMMLNRRVSLDIESKQNEMIFHMQRRSLEETDRLKREIESLSGRLSENYVRFKP